MRTAILAVLTLMTALCGGCNPTFMRSTAQPYMTTERQNHGLVIVLTGIEGRSRLNEDIAAGLADGGCPYGIEIYDWASSWFNLINQETIGKNKVKACELAGRIARYQRQFPDRPVILVGQSGGAAIAIWAAENMSGRRVDGIVLLAASISPGYRLDHALAASRRGIVSFYSHRDVLVLGLGTTVVRTMDGSFSTSAGKDGFVIPPESPREYQKLFEVPYDSRMSGSGNWGLHVTSSSALFVARYVEPIVMNTHWTNESINKIIDEAMNPRPASAHTSPPRRPTTNP